MARNGTAGVDVMLALRTGTATEHQQLEDSLDLLDPALDAARLGHVLDRMHGFWVTAEAGLDDWAAADPDTATALDWPARRRAHLFAADLAALGRAPEGDAPALDPVVDTATALGRLYVLEGSTLGGQFIDAHLATLPTLAGAARLHAFSPYGERTGAMWAAFRRVVRDRLVPGPDADTAVSAARRTFHGLAAWCTDVEQPASHPAVPSSSPPGGVPA
ncbi:biliverdin-producing heme oxygenase [Geodermatophilus sp. Leaf369]|uniref:biliverdin-producing heme oxygenase n=1 Tax=Geodermatophilus sp. Leaf369 TaxID=1736354 RepID=UPI001F237B71|nr:biliverdin-producing heme oxygenase [Geodermatophilus sp. Leaf369]